MTCASFRLKFRIWTFAWRKCGRSRQCLRVCLFEMRIHEMSQFHCRAAVQERIRRSWVTNNSAEAVTDSTVHSPPLVPSSPCRACVQTPATGLHPSKPYRSHSTTTVKKKRKDYNRDKPRTPSKWNNTKPPPHLRENENPSATAMAQVHLKDRKTPTPTACPGTQ